MRQIPRGIRNNNPGNIDYVPRNKWQGQLGLEEGVNNPRFARFDRPENGIRALAKLLLNYQAKGFNTVHKIVNRWAPGEENDTVSYVSQVAEYLDVQPHDILHLDAKHPDLLLLVRAIITHENGYVPYSDTVINLGIQSATK